MNIVISVGMKEFRHFRAVQPGRQLFFSVYVYQRTISLKAQEEQPDALDFQLNIPESNLVFRILFTVKRLAALMDASVEEQNSIKQRSSMKTSLHQVNV